MFNEKHVVICAAASGLLGLVTCITLAIVWTYWTSTLSNCSQGSCGCILYGHLWGSSFVGGDTLVCKGLTYFWLIISIVCLAVAVFYAIKVRKTVRERAANRNPESDTNRKPRTVFSIELKLISAVITILMFLGASIQTEGYYDTCKEYRTLVIKYLRASGDLADLVMERLSCSATYDFLDYLHPDAIIRRPEMPQYYYHRTSRIHTASTLMISCLFSWVNVIIWSIVTIFVGFCR